jgi:hypothetical protein
MTWLHRADDVRCILDDDTPNEFGKALAQFYALVAMATSNIDKEHCILVAFLFDNLSKRKCVKPRREASPTQVNPLHEASEICRMVLQPLETMLLGLVCFLPWTIHRILWILVIMALEEAWNGFVHFLVNGRTICGMSDVRLIGSNDLQQANTHYTIWASKCSSHVVGGVCVIIWLGQHPQRLIVAQNPLYTSGVRTQHDKKYLEEDILSNFGSKPVFSTIWPRLKGSLLSASTDQRLVS